MSKPFPERCLRGLRESGYIEEDQSGNVFVLSKAFEEDNGSRTDRVESRKKSNHYECSINWEDHLTESFRQLTQNTNARNGILTVLLVDLETAKQRCSLYGQLEWEREVRRGNAFHGNLLYPGISSKAVRRQFAAVIANCVQPGVVFTSPNNYQSELDRRAELELARQAELEQGKSIGLPHGWRRVSFLLRAFFARLWKG